MPGSYSLQGALNPVVWLNLKPGQAFGKIQGNLDLVFCADELLTQMLQLCRALSLEAVCRRQLADNQCYGKQIRLMLTGKPGLTDCRQGNEGG